MHPFEAGRPKVLPIGNVRGAMVFLKEFSVSIVIPHIVQVTSGIASYNRLQ